MPMDFKISVITPSFNSGKYIEKAISSVLDQDYTNFEHIIIDGGSTDDTLSTLQKYPHLIWTSEQDRGQVHAMNKGFARSTGDIIVYLNADDYFLCGAFSSVIPFFQKKHQFVVGDIIVQKPDTYFVNIPKIKLYQLIRHWELNAFPYNPIGYFYTREVQENFPFDENFPNMMDLRFLLESATKYNFVKINSLLGVYRCLDDTKTLDDQKNPNYWTEENFDFINKYVAMMPKDYQISYKQDRNLGYQKQRNWQLHNSKQKTNCTIQTESHCNTGLIDKIRSKIRNNIRKKNTLALPSNKAVKGQLDDHEFIIENGTPVVLIYQMGKVGSSSIFAALKEKDIPWPIYHIHYLSEKRLQEAIYWHEINDFKYIPEHIIVSQALKHFIQKNRNKVHWKIISLARDPIALQASIIFQNLQECFSEVIDINEDHLNIEKATKLIKNQLSEHLTRDSHFINWFDYEIKEVFGIDIYQYPFDTESGFEIISKGNVDILLLKLETLQQNFKPAIEKFLNISNINLPEANIGAEKKYGLEYKQLIQSLKLPKALCESIYNTQLAKHFYSENERLKFFSKWSNSESSHILPKPMSTGISQEKSQLQLTNYQKIGIDTLEGVTSFINKNILELGGDLQFNVAREFINRGANHVTALNYSPYFPSKTISDQIELVNMDARELTLPPNSFDLCYGAAILEHLNNFDTILNNLYRIMKNNAYVYLHGGPIWTCHLGHHVWVHVDKIKYEFNGLNPLPDWSHLIYNDLQMYNLLISKEVPRNHCKQIIDFVYNSEKLNRYCPTQLLECVEKSDFEIISFNRTVWKIPDDKTKKLIETNTNYSLEDLKTGQIEFILKKNHSVSN